MSLPIHIPKVGDIVDVLVKGKRVCPAIVTTKLKSIKPGHINCVVFDSEVFQSVRVVRNVPHESISVDGEGSYCWRDRSN